MEAYVPLFCGLIFKCFADFVFVPQCPSTPTDDRIHGPLQMSLQIFGPVMPSCMSKVNSMLCINYLPIACQVFATFANSFLDTPHKPCRSLKYSAYTVSITAENESLAFFGFSFFGPA